MSNQKVSENVYYVRLCNDGDRIQFYDDLCEDNGIGITIFASLDDAVNSTTYVPDGIKAFVAEIKATDCKIIGEIKNKLVFVKI